MTIAIRTSLMAQCRALDLSYSDLWREHKAVRRYRQLDPMPVAYESQVKDQLFAFDFCQIWIEQYAQLVLLALAVLDNDVPTPRRRQVQATLTISFRIRSDLAAVRLLATNGLDVQAKQLARAASENLDALSRAALDTDFCTAFVDEQDVDQTSAVWFKYIAKSRARDFVYARVESVIGSGTMNEQREHFKREETVLSAAVHPSHISGMFSLLPHLGDDEEDRQENAISANSVRTLEYCNHRVLEFMMYDLAVFSSVETFASTIPEAFGKLETNSLKKAAARLREVGLALMGYLIRNQDAYVVRSRKVA